IRDSLKNIYLLPVALVGAYGIINQYCLKMIGGPIGGMISDKILKSPSKYLCYTFIISTAALVLLIMLPHESMPVYLGMACTLGFGAIVFTQRAVFFAPIGEAKIAENKTGAAMALGSFIGYAPAMFCFSLYGYILDLNPGIIGYKIVFGIMACFAFSGAVVSVMLVKRISQRKKEMLAAEA
ncbi:MFS transporter, partial [Vibrio sp. FNV 38]|nr:MFS transporter [Vibrio sp. FNV 38]